MVQMSIRLPARSNRGPRPGLGGPARVDRRTKDLTKRLRPGDIAVIDHEDLDRVSAEALVACKPAAVVNASSSISGRYPNLGPEILVAAGIPLLDLAGPDVMAHQGRHRAAASTRARSAPTTAPSRTATVLDNEAVQEAMTLARAGLSDQLEAFAQNTMDYLRKERELLFDGVGVPDIRTDLDGRHALIVVRGYHYKDDLADPAALHPRVQADPHRRRRRRRRAHRGRPPARPHRRRHGLGVRRRAALRRRDRRARLPRRPRARARAGAVARASSPWSSPPPAPARTSRCCSPTTRAPR